MRRTKAELLLEIEELKQLLSEALRYISFMHRIHPRPRVFGIAPDMRALTEDKG